VSRAWGLRRRTQRGGTGDTTQKVQVAAIVIAVFGIVVGAVVTVTVAG
jgi:hypothetical protein